MGWWQAAARGHSHSGHDSMVTPSRPVFAAAWNSAVRETEGYEALGGGSVVASRQQGVRVRCRCSVCTARRALLLESWVRTPGASGIFWQCVERQKTDVSTAVRGSRRALGNDADEVVGAVAVPLGGDKNNTDSRTDSTENAVGIVLFIVIQCSVGIAQYSSPQVYPCPAYARVAAPDRLRCEPRPTTFASKLLGPSHGPIGHGDDGFIIYNI